MQRHRRSILLLFALMTGPLIGQSQSPPGAPPNAAPPVAMRGEFPPPLPGPPPPGGRAGVPLPKAPVYIVLTSRFSDHMHVAFALERIHKLIPLLREFRRQYPGIAISSVFQFSGSLSEVIATINEYSPIVQELKDAAKEGLIEIGYTGEDEPTYANRPQPNLLVTNTAEERWRERTGAAERFLTDYKDPITGDPVPGLTGGLKRMQDVFGNATLMSGTVLEVGDNSPVVHQLRRLNHDGILAGLRDPDSSLGIKESREGIERFGKFISPLPITSPEMYFEDNILRISDTGGPDLHSLSIANGLESIKTVLTKLDRTRPRIVHLEVGSYAEYLKKGPDGQPAFPPLQWAYTHPEEPEPPATLFNIVRSLEYSNIWKKEEEALRWLVGDFLRENSGSRFVSTTDLKKMTVNSLGGDVNAASLKAAAADLVGGYAITPAIPAFAFGGREYFSLADMFQMLSAALTEFDHTGALPPSVRLSNVYGPLDLTMIPGSGSGEVTVASVVRAAAGISDALRDSAWKPVPSNAVPTFIDVAGTKLNGGQFLKLMAQAYLNPDPAVKLKLAPCLMVSRAEYPHRAAIQDMGNLWTIKPAFIGSAPPPAQPVIGRTAQP